MFVKKGIFMTSLEAEKNILFPYENQTKWKDQIFSNSLTIKVRHGN